ncbi:hypothetical protein GGI25_000701 [Coemansia spiralis]|uniref:Rap-GAP domain-containing protein n=1 Tax=Coemansia spiralis TaxID=417178 RepID=A0A9W8G6Z9_9FUNG|nr:hypothetical protein GGI25_000701 [Coemansia spiralis]
MFFMKRRSKGGTGNSTWVLSDDHPILDLDDTLPLTDALGELSSLPPDYHTPVSTSLIQSLQDATRLQNQSDLEWFNTKQAPSNRLSKFKSFVEQCGPNEMVWIYTRYREVIFSMLYATFSQEVEYLNTLPERFLSPKLAAMSDLWMPFPCLHHLIELMPRLFASGWQQKEMENMLIVLLDHGNNQDVRALGFHFLCLYMAALQGNYSETIADLFTNSICLRAFSYVDMPAASRIASNIMCAIGSGIEIVDIGCGQRAIVGFHPGRASICPVLQDITHTINPQGVLALRMLKNVLSLVCYLASLISDPRSAYTVYISLGTIKRDIDPFQFNEQTTKSAFDLPQFAPMLALSAQELKSCLSDIYRLFCKAYLLWIYPNKEEPLRSRHVRRVPIHALRMFIGFMLNNLVPQYTFMISDKAFAVPYIEKDPQNISNIEIQGFHSVNNKMLGDIQTIRSHAYDALRCLMLDYNLDSASFFIDILRLSLQALPDLATQGCPKDSFDFGDVLNSGYTICLGALTIIRMWLVSKEAYRPAHLLVDNDNVYMLSNVIADYMEHVYGLIRWLVAEHKWDQKKLVLLYNALIIHRIITHLYSHHLPHYVKKIFLDNLQGIVVSFLQIIPGSSEDETAPSSYESCALTMLTESLVSGLLMLSNQTEEIITKFRELYSTETKWTSHLNVWCNVLRALTIARGRHILHVEERVLIQESMFSGQRQRRGMSKVDAYMNELDNPIYHLELDDTHDILDTATPFNITSNLVWNTMRLVFDAVNHDAQAEKLLIKDFAKVRHKIDSKQRHTSHSSPTSSSEAISSVYSGILASESKDLCQFSTSASKDVLSQAQSIIKTPQRVFRIQALSKDIPRSSLQYSDRIGSLPPDKIPVCARASQDSTSRPNYKASPSSGSLWKMIKQPFRKSKESFKSNMSLSYSRRNSAESGQIKSLDDPYKNKTVDTLYRTSDKTNRAQSTDTGNCRKGAEALQSSKRSYSRQRMPESSWEGMRESVQQPDNIASMEIEQQNQSLCPVGPALINADMLGIQVKFKSAHHHHKGSMRGTGIDAQKAEIALSNSQAVHSKIILRGMVSSWDLYRAVLDCSRYTPDNDDVMLNTTWWIAEMATTYSTSDYRGRLAQIAMFRIGCHCSDHISSRVLFLRSRFLQTALITLSPLAKGHAINIDQIQVFLVECRLALSLGISGSRLLLPTLDRGLRRIFLQRETYQGDFPDQAVHGAATLVVSMATMLSVGRSLAANHETQKVRKLEESNMADNNEFVRNLAGKIGAIEKCKYPIIYDPLGNRDYHVDWVDGGPIFGRCCETMWRILLDPSLLAAYSDKCCGIIEHTVLSGLTTVCFSELSIVDKSLQNNRVIDNCMAAITSGLFSTRQDTVRVAISNLSTFVIGQNSIMKFLGVVRMRTLTMNIMMAVSEQFDRSAHSITAGRVLVIRELITLLVCILIKAPELITRMDAFAEGVDAECIRDFLVDRIILACADPQSPNARSNHQYNQKLASFDSEKGIELRLEPASYSQTNSISLEDFMAKSVDDQSNGGNTIEALKQTGEILYITLLQYFDEYDRGRYQGAPGSDFDQTHIEADVHEDFSSERVFFYAHNSSVLKVYNEPDIELCRYILRSCTGKSALRIHFGPEEQNDNRLGFNKQDVIIPVINAGNPHSIYKNYSDTKAPIPVVSSLVVQDALEHQVENNDSVADMLDQDENKAAGSSNDVFGNVLAFVESEMEALNNSQLSNANSASSGSSKKSMNIFNGDNLNSLPTDNDSASSETDSVCNPIEPFSSGPISPLKVNLFRSLMQHKMAFNYNNTMPCYFLPLAKSESLYRDIRSLDRIHAHETIKVALLYVGPGQWNEVEILSNTVADTSASYQSFINSLGWQVNLTTFHGYTGKLEQCGTDGTTCPYFAEDGLELVFHEVTSMPNYANDARRLNKKRHIGNDHVHIIWNESRHTYRPETISGDFGNVQIHIRPLEPGEYGINMYCDDQIRPFGPLTDGMVVSAEVLPAVVRTTAINGHRRATQAFFRSFTHPYVIRQQNINRIVEKHIDRSWLRTLYKEQNWL